MTPTSRIPRARLAGRKVSRRKTVPYGEADRLDAEGLQRAIDLLNVGKTDRDPTWVSPTTLALFASPFGGSTFRTQWAAYMKRDVKKRRRIKMVDKLIAGLFFARYDATKHLRMLDIFPSLVRFEPLMPLPVGARAPSAVVLMLLGIPERDESEYTRVVELYLRGTPEQRKLAHAALGATMATDSSAATMTR